MPSPALSCPKLISGMTTTRPMLVSAQRTFTGRLRPPGCFMRNRSAIVRNRGVAYDRSAAAGGIAARSEIGPRGNAGLRTICRFSWSKAPKIDLATNRAERTVSVAKDISRSMEVSIGVARHGTRSRRTRPGTRTEPSGGRIGGAGHVIKDRARQSGIEQAVRDCAVVGMGRADRFRSSMYVVNWSSSTVRCWVWQVASNRESAEDRLVISVHDHG